jgi:hypothetical protein
MGTSVSPCLPRRRGRRPRRLRPTRWRCYRGSRRGSSGYGAAAGAAPGAAGRPSSTRGTPTTVTRWRRLRRQRRRRRRAPRPPHLPHFVVHVEGKRPPSPAQIRFGAGDLGDGHGDAGGGSERIGPLQMSRPPRCPRPERSSRVVVCGPPRVSVTCKMSATSRDARARAPTRCETSRRAPRYEANLQAESRSLLSFISVGPALKHLS